MVGLKKPRKTNLAIHYISLEACTYILFNTEDIFWIKNGANKEKPTNSSNQYVLWGAGKKIQEIYNTKVANCFASKCFSPRIFPCLPLLCESFANNANLFGTLISSAAAICIFAQHAIYTALVSFKCFHSSQCSPSSWANWYIEQLQWWSESGDMI